MRMLRNLFGMGSASGAPSFEADGGTSGGGAAGATGGADDGATGGQPPEGGAEGGGGKPPEGGAAPDTFTLKVNGKEESYTREQILELASKGGDYQGKTTTLAEERKAFESDRESLIRSETDKRIEQMLEEDRRKAGDDESLSDSEKNTRRITSLEQRQQDEGLENKIAMLQDKHGKDFNRALFIDMATQAGVQNLNELDALAVKHIEQQKSAGLDLVKTILADENHPLTKEFSKKITDAWVEKKLKASPAGGGGSTGPTEIPTGKDGKPLTDDEIDDISTRELQGLN